MEPLDENELTRLLRKWEAPSAPPALRKRLFPAERSTWRWLLNGTIRIPVPVALAAAILIGLWLHYYSKLVSHPAQVAQPNSVSLVDFQPVRQLKPVVVGEKR